MGRYPITQAQWREVASWKQVVRKIYSDRFRRLEGGLHGDYKSIGEGIFELRLFFGAGYRVYFGEDGEKIVILLCGGDKSTQKKDIKAAKAYWQEYQKDD